MKFVNNALFSTKFDDIYFDMDDPINEREFVYAGALNLIQKPNLVVAEAGFGVGLNFFVTAKKALNLGKSLHFISCEKYPLCKDDLKKIMTKFNEFSDIFDKFIDQYEIIPNALVRIKISQNIILDLFFGDILDFFDQSDFRADIWYLDGFAPSKNPDMWSDEVFAKLGEFCHKGSIIRTYSVASKVKSALQNNGFYYEKLQGNAKKKQILQAICQNPKPKNYKNLWFKQPNLITPKQILVIGGGISGLSTAYQLQNLNFEVILCEANDSVAMSGSSNKTGLLAPLITKPNVKLGLMHLSAFLLARNFYFNSEFSEFCDFSGAWHYACDKKSFERFKAANSDILPFFDDFSPYPASFIPKAVQIRPKELCKAISSKLQVRLNHKFKHFIRKNDKYFVSFENGKILEADLIIFALGDGSKELFKKLFNDEFIRLSNVRGQTTLIEPSLDLKSPFSARAYVCKTYDDTQLIGSTFDRQNDDLSPLISDDELNLANLSEFLGDKKPKIIGSNTAFRCYSGDRFPIIGAIYNHIEFAKNYKSLLWTKHHQNQPKPVYYPNLLINSAHGAHGLASAIFGAEIICDMLLNRQICTSLDILDELNSSRFLIRLLKKGLV